MASSSTLALRWRHFDLDRKILQVREALEETKAHGVQIKAPKSKAGRRDITLPDIVVGALREYRRAQLELRMRLGLGKVSDEDDLLFPTLEGSLPSPRAFSAEWADVAASIGMPDITPAAHPRLTADRRRRRRGDNCQAARAQRAKHYVEDLRAPVPR
jgi:integrase